MKFNKSEPQNIEYRTAELRKEVSLRLGVFELTEYLTSIFDIHDSIFDIGFYKSLVSAVCQPETSLTPEH